MEKNRGVIHDLRNWIAKHMRVEQPKNNSSQFVEQVINLEPVFNTQTMVFEGVLCNDLYKLSDEKMYLKHFKQALENIAYWCCHGRTIMTI